MNQVGLTLDVDWAPDVVIDAVAARLLAAGVRATWFVTHASPAIDRLRKHGGQFELGIHPNFLPGSTHGTTTTSVLEHCIGLVPEAVSMRSHSVYQHGRLYSELLAHTPIRVDGNTFLPEMEHIRPLDQPIGTGTLHRIPFMWADDYELSKKSADWNLSRFNHREGLQIFTFHPIHVYLNTRSLIGWAPLVRETGAADLAARLHDGIGTATAFDALVERIAGSDRGFLMRDFLPDGRARRQ